MKTSNPFICLVLALLIFSCNDDDELPSNTRDNLIVLKAHYFRSNGPEYQTIVVTDPNGKVLATSKSTYWMDTPIKPSLIGYRGDLVNLYLIDHYNSYNGISAFLNLQRGSEFVGPLYEYNVPPLEALRLKFGNVEPFDQLTFSTDFYGSTITQLADTVGLLQNAYIEGGRAYGQFVSNGKGSYGFFDVDQQLGIATLDRAGMDKPSSSFTIKLGSNVAYSNFSLVGSFDPTSKGWGYQLFSTWNTSQLEIYYPEESFAKYFSDLNYSADGKYYKVHREGSSLNLNYEKIAFDGTVTDNSPKNFHMETTGEFDYYVASYSSENTYLTVYSSQHYDAFKIPDFSDIEGISRFPFADLKWLQVELMDYEGVVEDEANFKFFTSGNFAWPRNSSSVSISMSLP